MLELLIQLNKKPKTTYNNITKCNNCWLFMKYIFKTVKLCFMMIRGVHKNIITIRDLGDLSKTNMPDWRLRHASSKTHRRPTCLNGDPLDTSTCFIGNTTETNMPHYIIPICINKQKVYKNIKIIFKCAEIPIRLRRHVSLWWGMSVSNEACLGLRSGMLVFDRSPMGLQWVYDGSPIVLR